MFSNNQHLNSAHGNLETAEVCLNKALMYVFDAASNENKISRQRRMILEEVIGDINRLINLTENVKSIVLNLGTSHNDSST